MPRPSRRSIEALERRLSRVPSYREMLSEYQAERVPIGAMPPSPSLAWWFLSRRAKELLLAERLTGRFGGIPGQAPYWLVQEKGEVKANVQARRYIARAVAQWRSELGLMIKQWIGAYSFKEQAERDILAE